MSLILFALLCFVGTRRDVILGSVMGIPLVLLLMFFAFGGDVPLRLRESGHRRDLLVGIIGWISILAGIFIMHFYVTHE